MERWPFQQLTSLLPDQQQRWVDHCYVRSSVDDLLADSQRSTVVITSPGSGISTSLSLLGAQPLLTFTYAPDQWPGEQQAFTSAPDHFSQMMAHVAHLFTASLRANPAALEQCAPMTHEFLAWMVRCYLGTRQDELWLRFVQQQLGEPGSQLVERLRNSMRHDLYTNTTVGDIYSQIDECLDLAHVLG